MFEEGENEWDYHRGRLLESAGNPSASETKVLDRLATMLRSAAWRPASRVNYNAWFRTWLEFCLVNNIRPLPVQEIWFARFLTFITLRYAVSSVKVAASAVVAVCRLNGFSNPLKNSTVLSDMLTAIEKVGMVGSRVPKCIVDTRFMLGVVEHFVDKYPVFDREVFDPRVKGRSVIELRGVGLMVFGLELGVRPSSVTALTTCCWQPRRDRSVGVQVDLMKNGKNGEVFCPVLDFMEGTFAENCSAISFAHEYLLPFIEEFGPAHDPAKCLKKRFRTVHCTNCPKLFQVFGEGKVNQAVKASEVSDVVKRWATRLKRDKSKYSAVSLRRASTSIAAAQGVCKKIRQRHGGWKSSRMPDVYTEVSKANEKAVSKAIHKAMQKSKKNRHKKVHFEFKT